MNLLTIFAAYCIAWILLLSGLDKILHASTSNGSMRILILDENRSTLASQSLGLIEAILASLILCGVFVKVALLCILALLASFLLVNVLRFKSGYSGLCGCGGLFARAPLDMRHLVVVTLMLLTAALSAFETFLSDWPGAEVVAAHGRTGPSLTVTLGLIAISLAWTISVSELASRLIPRRATTPIKQELRQRRAAT
jgi:uncharacterized membrane protein YphA (DoxX/SURF4 family)